MNDGQRGEADEGAQGHELTHGQIENAGGLIDENKPEGDQAIDAAGGHSRNDDLN